MHIPLRLPTTRAWWDPSRRARVPSSSPVPSRAAGQSRTRPRTSSAVSAIFEERAHAGGALLQARRFYREQRFRQAATRGTDDAFAHEMIQSAVIVVTSAAHRLESRHWTSPVHNQHRRTPFDAVNERAEIVLGFRNTGLLHNGQNSLIEVSLQAVRPRSRSLVACSMTTGLTGQ